MYKISDEVKQLILNIGNGVYVNYILTFPELDLTITNDTLYQESIKIIQSLCEDEELTLGGCIASSMTFEVAEIIDKDINNCRFSAGIQLVDNTGKKLADTIPMGVFAVASAKSVDDKDYKDVTAYDDMYYKASVDVTKWYDNYFPIIGTTTNKDSEGNSITTNVYGKTTLRQFRNDLLEHLGISYRLQDLPNDDMVVEKTISISNGSISGQALLKMICTLHGGFGIMNREGRFVVVHVTGGALYPEEILYPEETLYPEEEFQYIGVNGTDELLYPEYRTVSYEEYMCNHITCVNLRTDSEDLGVTVGSDISNPYVISANYFLYGKSAAELEIIGSNILEKISGITYRPCTIDAQGLPHVDVGDAVALEKKIVDIESFVFSRTLSGIQNIRDEYSAKGTEIRENEVSANEEFEQLKSKTIKITKSVDGLSVELADLEKNTASKFEQTAESITAEVARANAAEGDLSGRISITADAVTQEVTRAKGEEATLSGRITVTADAITQEVTRAKAAEGELSGRINVTADQVTAEVKRAEDEENSIRTALTLKADSAELGYYQTKADMTNYATTTWAENKISSKVSVGDVCSEINQSSDEIIFNSNRLVINSTNFTLDQSGNISMKGKVEATSGSVGPFSITSSGLEWAYGTGTKIWSNVIFTDFIEAQGASKRLVIGAESSTNRGKVDINSSDGGVWINNAYFNPRDAIDLNSSKINVTYSSSGNVKIENCVGFISEGSSGYGNLATVGYVKSKVSSDERIKKNIVDIPNVKDVYMDIPVYQFEYNGILERDGICFGTTAQGIERAFEKHKLDIDKYNIVQKRQPSVFNGEYKYIPNGDDLHYINWENVNGMSVYMIQELVKDVEALKQEIEDFKQN